MRATLRSLHSPDVQELDEWDPGQAAWALHIQLIVGPQGDDWGESFDVTVCSPLWIAERAKQDRVVSLRFHYAVDLFDFGRIEQYFSMRVQRCEGADWTEVGALVGRIGLWEFEDYRK